MSVSDRQKHASSDLAGSVFLIDSNGQILNLPIPSRSPHDPLNWSTWKRRGAFLSLDFFGMCGLVQLLGATLLYTSVQKEFATADIAPLRFQWYISGPSLALGIGGIMWIPLSLAIGRRPVFLITTLILLMGTIMASFATSFQQLLIAVCLQGLALSLRFGNALLMLIDLTFIHERPRVIAMYYSLVPAAASILHIAIPIIIKVNWRMFYRVLIAPCAASFLLAFFFSPETYFYRPAIAFNGRVLVQSATEKIQIYDDWEEVPGGKPLPDKPIESRYMKLRNEYRIMTKIPGGWKNMGVCYMQVFLALTNPLILWVALLNLLMFAGMVVMQTTSPIILQLPPYNFSLWQTGLGNLAGAAGILLAWPASSIMNTQFCHRLIMRNGGLRDAEYYLPLFFLPIVSGAAGSIVYGLAAEYNWRVGWLLLSFGLNSFACITLFTATTLWVTEAFPRWAAAALVIVGTGSYAASFSLSGAIVPWIASQGYARTMGVITALTIAAGAFVLPVAIWGRRYRYYLDSKWAFYEGGSLRPQQQHTEA